jgi:histidine ammonia-lyase
VALALDWLRPALTSVASIAERRVFRLTNGDLSGLPSFLVAGTGLNSGLMLAQYTAASLVSECKGLSHPASVDSLPTVQAREDHVSMGPVAARMTLEVTECVADVLAIELLCAAQGVDLRQDGGGKALGAGTTRVHRAVRSRVTRWRDDRVLHPDLVAAGNLVREGVFADLLPWARTP